MGQECEPLDAFVVREVLLQGVDAFSDEFDDAFVAAQVFVRESCNALALGPFLEGGEIGYDERRDEFALVGNDDGLFKMTVDGEFALNELWGGSSCFRRA